MIHPNFTNSNDADSETKVYNLNVHIERKPRFDSYKLSFLVTSYSFISER